MDMKERREMMFAELAMARHFTESDVAVAAVNRVDSLLREVPTRECDVGTPEEQYKRFRRFCFARHCSSCPYNSQPSTLMCVVRWMTDPHMEGGGNGQERS